MKHIKDDTLRRFVGAVFAKAGSTTHEADMIARRLVDSNLMGHDSHGVVRVTSYIGWLKEGKIHPNRHVKVVTEADAFAIL
ncbi:MAG: Ldh family oxidoreductase, partial [Alphaproteobacteria bacterium]|nr:Ldh family oxidoreductase [Alphaproteobacteria bacterium]